MSLENNITHNDIIKNEILTSGGTIVFSKDNIIVASEISEKQFRNLLDNPYITKIDVLPLKRYKDDSSPYKQVSNTENVDDIYGENQID